MTFKLVAYPIAGALGIWLGCHSLELTVLGGGCVLALTIIGETLRLIRRGA